MTPLLVRRILQTTLATSLLYAGNRYLPWVITVILHLNVFFFSAPAALLSIILFSFHTLERLPYICATLLLLYSGGGEGSGGGSGFLAALRIVACDFFIVYVQALLEQFSAATPPDDDGDAPPTLPDLVLPRLHIQFLTCCFTIWLLGSLSTLQQWF